LKNNVISCQGCRVYQKNLIKFVPWKLRDERITYLSISLRKESSLYVLFVTLRCVPNECVFYRTLDIIGKLSMSEGAEITRRVLRGGVQTGGFIMFRPTALELLNIEQFFHWNFFIFQKKLKLKKIEIHFIDIVKKPWMSKDSMEMISYFLNLLCGWFAIGFRVEGLNPKP
jgi:hypothetical protein